MNRQSQRAGEGASQYQVSGDLVVVEGITEERARAIATEVSREAIREFTAESVQVAEERVAAFDERVIVQLSSSGLLGALADPSVQRTLRKAQISAACSERDDDYEMLAGLIADRTERPGNRQIRAAIDRAVEVVDQLDSDALAGLTMFHAVNQFSPASGSPPSGVETMESLLVQLMPSDGNLPPGLEWLEHLDILDIVRINHAQDFLPFDDYCVSKTPGYASIGLLEDAPEIAAVDDDLRDYNFNLVPTSHEFKTGFVRVGVPNLRTIRKNAEGSNLPSEDVEKIVAIVDSRYHVETIDNEAKRLYLELVRSQPTQAAVAEWWDSLPVHFTVTAVGRVLARANAKRLDYLKLLPSLD